MSRVFRHANGRWYIDFRDHTGKRRQRAAGATRAEAQELLRAVERAIKAVGDDPPPAAVTLAGVAEEWLRRRQRRQLRTATANDAGYLKTHILPALGHRPVGEIRVAEVRAFVESLQTKGLAPRTIRNIYAALRKLFADLLVEEVIDRTPCVLGRDHLPPNEDKDPEWRATAVFSAEEVALLISSELIPADRRMLYALYFFTGARLAEAIALKWSDIEDARPLRRLHIQRSARGRRTKTRVSRQVPVHPLLGRLLEEWRAGGAVSLLGREPTADDPIVPSPKTGRERDKHAVSHRRRDDLERLDLRPRRLHDARRTFVSLARAGGARLDVVRTLTHTSSRDVLDLYTSLPWETLCEAVLCLRIPDPKAHSE